jgi:ribosome-associated translation inhibitor RaiA
MNPLSSALESYEISPRFRQTIEDRISRLEGDAAADELALATLEHEDHIRRHRRLIAVQRAEALRMQLFLDRTRTRLQHPLTMR